MSERNIMMVKLGGSVITNKFKEFTARSKVINRLAKEIHCFNGRSKTKLIVAHGGGSFPHVYARQFKVHIGGKEENIAEGISKVQDSAARLNRIVFRCLARAGEKPISIQPSACALARNGRIVKWDTTIIEKALDLGLTPVPYGDVAFDELRNSSILSTEEILRYLASKLPTKRIIIGVKEDGVLDGKGLLVPIINKANVNNILKWVKGSAGIDVTGGMRSKILTLFEIVKADDRIECIIANISQPEILRKCLDGKMVRGTRICA